MFQLCVRFVVVCVLVCTNPARADDIFVRVPLTKLEFTNGSLPTYDADTTPWRLADILVPMVVIDGPGEAYVSDPVSDRLDSQPSRHAQERGVLFAKLPSDKSVTGTLFVPDAAWKTLKALRFTLKPAASDASKDFYRAKAAHYEQLQATGAPGAAFFRHEAAIARRAAGDDPASDEQRPRVVAAHDLDDTYDLFTGGKALSENLQLSRQFPPALARQTAPDEQLVDAATIEGITIRAFDWTARLADAKPALDPLASIIPADQHAVFFPGFQGLMTALHTVNEEGLPIYRGMRGATEDGMLLQRYELQLCLSPTALARLLESGAVQSVAITGGDPYFPTGTDVAVVFQSSDTSALQSLLLGQIKLAQGNPGVSSRSGDANGVKYQGAVSDDRAVCSFAGACGSVVVLTNSLEQLKRIADVQSGAAPSIATLTEYQFFRARYPVGGVGETAFVFISDPTIRRWCGPQSRIAASKRLRALAIMADATAAHMDQLVAGVVTPTSVIPDTPMRTIGDVTLTPMGIRSSVYGGLRFVTPVSELDLKTVTTDEADAYKRWRDTYQRNWSVSFDPIAISIGLEKDRVTADLSVMPLIMNSQYRTWATIAQGVSIAAGAGDQHDAILHAVFAINTQSVAAQQVAGMASMMARGIQIDPFGWMGKSVAVYADADPFWERLLLAEDPEKLFEKEGFNLPIAVHAEVSSAVKLTAFLASVRTLIEQTAPGMAAWETRTYHEQPYVCVGLSEKAKAEGEAAGFDKTQLLVLIYLTH